MHPKKIVATKNDEDLFHYLVSMVNSTGTNSAVLFSMLSIALLFAQAFMVNYMVNEYRMTTRPSFFPAMAYLLITSLLPEWNYLSSPLVACTLIIWAFIKVFRLYNLSSTKGEVFNIGLIIGLSSYIYFPAAAFVICLLFGILILIPFRPNEIILFLMGFLTPYYFYGAYLFLNDQLSFASFLPHISVQVPVVKSSIFLAVATVLLAVPFLIGGYFIQAHMHKMLIQVRKNWSILLLYILLAFFIPFINTYTSFNNWVLIAAPFAAFHANAYYYPAKKWLPVVLFTLTVAFIFFQQYATKIWLE